MIDAIRLQQLSRWAEDKARDHSLDYADIASYRDVVTAIAELARLRAAAAAPPPGDPP